MAGNMDPNDIQGVAEAMNELRDTGTLTAATLNKLSDSSLKTKEAQEKLAQSLIQYSRKVTGSISELAGGNGSFKSLSGTIDVAATTISALTSKLGILGKGLGLIATGVAEAAKVALSQLDFLAENYNAMGSASATATDGIEGLSRQFDALGNYGLPAFTKAVKINSLGLNVFKGTAAEGAEALSKIAGALTQGKTAERFIRIGMSLDEVGDTTTSFIANYSRLGLLQGSTTEELTKKTQNYIEEVDKIARLTGQTRAQQQDEQAKTLADARSRAELSQMRARGETVAAGQLEQLMKAFDAATNSAVRATATGIPLTKQAQSFGVFTRDEIRQTVLAVKRGEINAVEGTARINKALAQGAQTFGKQISYAGDIFEGAAIAGFDAESRELALIELRQKAEYRGLSDAQIVEKEQAKTASSANEATKKYASATLAASGANKDLQRLGMKLAITATPAIDAFANALNRATNYVNKKFGLSSSASSASGADVDRILSTIRTRESGGDYSIQNPDPKSTASGAYQFIDSTWQGLTKKYGIGQEFGRAKLAPKEIQDAIAKAYVNDILKQAGGDVSKVPLAWYTGNIQGKMSASALNANKGQTAEAYQSKWMSEYSGSQTPSGPTGGYKPYMSGMNPSSAGAETTAQGNQAASQQQSQMLDNRMIKQLAELNQTSRELLVVNKKILQRQS
jgi:hypothetical protein